MKKVLYVYGGGEKFHPSRATGELLSKLMIGDGRFKLEMTNELNAFASLDEKPNGRSGEKESGHFTFI